VSEAGITRHEVPSNNIIYFPPHIRNTASLLWKPVV